MIQDGSGRAGSDVCDAGGEADGGELSGESRKHNSDLNFRCGLAREEARVTANATMSFEWGFGERGRAYHGGARASRSG